MQAQRHLDEDPDGHTFPSVDELPRSARSRLDRLTPRQAAREQAEGALLVDIRSEMLRRTQGEIPGSLVLERNVLEWRLDPCSGSRIEEAVDHALRVVVFCPQGYMSGLAAASLKGLGLSRATDLAGGYEAWREAGLPVVQGATMTGSYVAASMSGVSLDPRGQRLLEELRASIGDWSGSRSRSVDLHVHRIRRKLGPRAASLLTTERGVGFRMRAAPARSGS